MRWFEVVIVDPPVLNELQLFFKKVTWYSRDFCTAKLELRKVSGFMRDEFFRLHMTVPTDSLGPVKSGQEVIKKNNSSEE